MYRQPRNNKTIRPPATHRISPSGEVIILFINSLFRIITTVAIASPWSNRTYAFATFFFQMHPSILTFNGIPEVQRHQDLDQRKVSGRGLVVVNHKILVLQRELVHITHS